MKLNSILTRKNVVHWVVMMLVFQIVLEAFERLSAVSTHKPMFLSFRGADVRETYASLTYDKLTREGLTVFMDDNSMRTGHQIELAIGEAINNSMGAVIIFSKDFASSEWCLNELILILRRKRELGSGYVLTVLFVDDLQPHDIYDLRGSYAKALAKHKDKCRFYQWSCKEMVEEWRAALKQVAKYKGCVLNQREWSSFINDVVKEIRQECIKLGIEMNPRHPFFIRIDELIKKLASDCYSTYRNWKTWVLLTFLIIVVWCLPNGNLNNGGSSDQHEGLNGPQPQADIEQNLRPQQIFRGVSNVTRS